MQIYNCSKEIPFCIICSCFVRLLITAEIFWSKEKFTKKKSFKVSSKKVFSLIFFLLQFLTFHTIFNSRSFFPQFRKITFLNAKKVCLQKVWNTPWEKFNLKLARYFKSILLTVFFLLIKHLRCNLYFCNYFFCKKVSM